MHHCQMAFANPKSHLFPTQGSLSTLLKIFISFLLLQYHNVQSQTPSPLSASETFSFGFTAFEPLNLNAVLMRDASVSSGVLWLTKGDPLGQPLPNSVGRIVYVTPVHLWDRSSGELADFSSGFSFVVNPKGSTPHGDGLAFFIARPTLEFPKNSSGGYLGLFSPETALDTSKNKIVAIEFDSFSNEWDPEPVTQLPHIGIDVNSVKSVATAAWPIDLEGSVAHASINYNSESKRLSVFLAYPEKNTSATVSYVIDLRTVLPEYVIVGLSAATGSLVETHDVLNWSFEAAL